MPACGPAAGVKQDTQPCVKATCCSEHGGRHSQHTGDTETLQSKRSWEDHRQTPTPTGEAELEDGAPSNTAAPRHEAEVLDGGRRQDGLACKACSSSQHRTCWREPVARRPPNSAQVPRTPMPPLVTMRTGYKQKQPPSIKHVVPETTANTELQMKQPIKVARGHGGGGCRGDRRGLTGTGSPATLLSLKASARTRNTPPAETAPRRRWATACTAWLAGALAGTQGHWWELPGAVSERATAGRTTCPHSEAKCAPETWGHSTLLIEMPKPVTTKPRVP